MSINLNAYAQGKPKGMTKALLEPRTGMVLTIDKLEEKSWPTKDGPPDVRLICHWVEDKPPLSLNKTAVKFLLANFGPEEKDWAGRKVEVWHDPTVEFQGKRVGGLVLRLPGRELR